MKHLYLLSGPMGVGKTAVSTALNKLLPASVMLDGDWLWMADPFVVTEETKAMVMGNIHHVLQAFLSCSAYEHVIFCWVMNKTEIAQDVLKGLSLDGVCVHKITLTAGEETLIDRVQRDIAAGKRMIGSAEKSITYLRTFEKGDFEMIATDGKTPEAIAKAIADMAL